MKDEFTIQQIADAVNLTRYQIEAWISRGHFTPTNPAEPGKSRVFTFTDAVALGVLADCSRLGLNAATASMHLTHVRFITSEDTLLVIAQKIMMAQGRPGDPEEEFDISYAKLIREADIPALNADKSIRAFTVVKVGEIARHIRDRLTMA